MEEEFVAPPTVPVSFTAVTVAVAGKPNLMDQVSIFPDWPAPVALFPEIAKGGDTFPTPQVLLHVSEGRAHMYLKGAFGINLQGHKKVGLNAPITLNVSKVTIVVSKGFPDQVILYTDLPSPLRHPVPGKSTTLVFMVDEGYGKQYATAYIPLEPEIFIRNGK